MSKSFILKNANQLISLIFMIMIISMIQGCAYYKVSRSQEPPAPTMLKFQDEKKFIILHYGDSAWNFRDIIAADSVVTGYLYPLRGHDKYRTTNPDGANRYKRSVNHDESEVLNEVHIYTTELAEEGLIKASFPAAAVNKIEVFDPAVGATVASYVFSGLAIAIPVIVVVALLTKESCPFIYVSDDDSYKFIGEIYSGAIYPSLERDDYLPLPGSKPGQAEYKIKMTNEVHEIQNTNLVELQVIDHPSGTSVLMDKYGNYQTMVNPQSPAEAVNLKGKNILEMIRERDTLLYFGNNVEKDESSTDGIILKFKRPPDASHAKLVINAKSTFWLDYVFTRFHSLFGDQYDCWVTKQETIPDKQMKDWNIEQKIPLLVYLEKKGKWEFIDYYNVTGPMAAREDVLPIDLTDVKTDTVRIKLEYGFMFWEIDYAAIDFSPNAEVIQRTATLEVAFENNETDVRKLLESTDLFYYVQDEIGDKVDMRFTIPPRIREEQSLFLHSRGYYKILLEGKGKQQVKYLLSFRKKGRFPEFSNQLFHQQAVSDLVNSAN